jgi:hypothetical protein
MAIGKSLQYLKSIQERGEWNQTLTPIRGLAISFIISHYVKQYRFACRNDGQWKKSLGSRTLLETCQVS